MHYGTSESFNTEVRHASSDLRMLLAAVTEPSPNTHSTTVHFHPAVLTLFAPADVWTHAWPKANKHTLIPKAKTAVTDQQQSLKDKEKTGYNSNIFPLKPHFDSQVLVTSENRDEEIVTSHQEGLTVLKIKPPSSLWEKERSKRIHFVFFLCAPSARTQIYNQKWFLKNKSLTLKVKQQK